MTIEFDDEALKELYTTGTTTNRKYKKLSTEIIRQYIKVVNYIKAAPRIEYLYHIKSLHYERKEGTLKDIEAVWINKKYRLLFRSFDDNNIKVNVLLIEISKHYEK